LFNGGYCNKDFLGYVAGMPKKGQPPAKFDVAPEYLRGMARRLAYVAKRYGEIAEQIPENTAIRVTGKPTAERSQGLLEGWMATLQGGLDDLAMSVDEPGRKVGRKAAKDARDSNNIKKP
jgi:hypothetical protein